MTPTSSVSTRAVVLRFLLIFIPATVALFAIAVGLEMAGVSLGSATNNLGIIVPAVAAVLSGDYFFQQSGRRPRGGESWRYGAIFAGILFLFTLAVFMLFWPIPEIPEEDFGLFVAILAVICLILLPIFRIAFGFGARASEKRAAALEEKAAKDKR